MPLIDFSQEDIQRGRLITPGWYRVKISSVEEALSKAGDSTNWLLKGNIVKHADNGDKEFEGVPTPYWNFNSKAKGFMIGYFAAHGITPESGKRYELNDTAGKEIDVFISNELYNGNMVNRINHQYRAPR